MTTQHILVAEDDTKVRDLLCSYLGAEGFVAHGARNGQELRAALRQHPIGLITLEVTLAGEDGLLLLREIRTIRNVPVILISAKGGDVDRIVGLEVGADDYIAKPFNLREVLARIRAILRRLNSNSVVVKEQARVIRFGEWTLSSDSRELRQTSGDLVKLTSAEFNLLEALAKHPSRILTRESLLDLTRGDAADQLDRSIDVLIGRLRKKIEPNPETPIFIKTVRGVGYMFTGAMGDRSPSS